MKKTKRLLSIAFIIALVTLCFSTPSFAGESVAATPTQASLQVNGEAVNLQAYNVNGSNYYKLRDLAQALNGTDKQFEVAWDNTVNAIMLTGGKAYTAVGGEFSKSDSSSSKTAVVTTDAIYLDGSRINIKAYNVDGNNYFNLRDLAAAIGFTVTWDRNTNHISISTGSPMAAGGYKVGQAMPDFTVNTIDGGKFALSEHRGKPAFINLFATWCPPCMGEMPDIQMLYSQYGNRLEVLVIDMNEGRDTALKFASEHSYTMPVGYSDAFGSFDMEYIPDTFIVDENGIIQYAYVGAQKYATFSSALEDVLK